MPMIHSRMKYYFVTVVACNRLLVGGVGQVTTSKCPPPRPSSSASCPRSCRPASSTWYTHIPHNGHDVAPSQYPDPNSSISMHPPPFPTRHPVDLLSRSTNHERRCEAARSQSGGFSSVAFADCDRRAAAHRNNPWTSLGRRCQQPVHHNPISGRGG